MALGPVSLAMPAMTAVVVGSAGPDRAGLASGMLNAARQSGGALGVALLGALFAAAGPHAAPLRARLSVAAGGFLVAIGVAWLATGQRQVPDAR